MYRQQHYCCNKTRNTQKALSAEQLYFARQAGFFDNPDDEARCLGDSILLAATIDPEELAIDREAELHILHGLKAELTELELSVLRLYISGKSYAQIAENIGRSTKTVDNALTRIKKKVSKLIHANNHEQS